MAEVERKKIISTVVDLERRNLNNVVERIMKISTVVDFSLLYSKTMLKE